jgi:hypothetical protein
MRLSTTTCKRRLCTCALIVLALLPARASAQQRFAVGFETVTPTPTAPVLFEQERVEQMNEEGRMTTSGFFLGIVGMLAGAAVGSGVGNAKCGDDCVGRVAAGGASIAGALMVPVGVHIAALSPKRFPLAIASSFVTGAAVWGGINAIPGRPMALAPFVAAPLQVWFASRLERSPTPADSAAASPKR